MKIRIIALLLTVIMLAGVLPAAAESEPGVQVPAAEEYGDYAAEMPEDSAVPEEPDSEDDSMLLPGTADDNTAEVSIEAASDEAPAPLTAEPALTVDGQPDNATTEADLPEEKDETLPAEESGILSDVEPAEANDENVLPGVPVNISTSPAGPVITEQPIDVKAALGSNVSFSVVAEGEGLTYQWRYRNSAESAWHNTTLTGCNTDTLIMTAILDRNGKQYCCVITNRDGVSVTSQAATLTIQQASIKIEKQPANQLGAMNEVVSFTVEATGDGLTYQWKYREDGSSS